jgi:hypothetical protein
MSYKYQNLLFIEEILKNSFLLTKIQPKMSNIFLNNTYNYQKKYVLFYRSSIKSVMEDFYLINSFCKNSLAMNNFSMDYRNLNKNFFF